MFYADASEAASGINKTILKLAITEPCGGAPVIGVALKFDSNGELSARYSQSTGNSSFNSTEILIEGSQAPAKAGEKYYWIAGVIAGLS